MLGLEPSAAAPASAEMRGVVVPVNGPAGLLPGGSASGSRGGAAAGLSPAKLVEMSEGFASYSASTADVDRDGAGRDKAAQEFVNLLISPEGSTLQDILVEEAVRFGDAAVRQALRVAVIDAPSSVVSGFGLEPPAKLKEALAASAEEERVLRNAGELADLVGPSIQSRLNTLPQS